MGTKCRSGLVVERLSSFGSVVDEFKGCLYESRDGRLLGRDVTRDPGMYMFPYYLSRSVYTKPGRSSSRLGGISLSATGISAEAGRFSSYKRFIPGDRDEIMLTCNIEIRKTAGNSRKGGHIT